MAGMVLLDRVGQGNWVSAVLARGDHNAVMLDVSNPSPTSAAILQVLDSDDPVGGFSRVLDPAGWFHQVPWTNWKVLITSVRSFVQVQLNVTVGTWTVRGEPVTIAPNLPLDPLGMAIWSVQASAVAAPAVATRSVAVQRMTGIDNLGVHHITGIYASYSQAATGLLTLVDGVTTVLAHYVVNSFALVFPRPWRMSFPATTQLALASGGAGVTGQVTLTGYTVGTSIGALP